MKTYRARSYTIFSLKGKVEDRVVKVEFIPAMASKSTAVYTTDKEDEIVLIENSKDFKEGSIYLVGEVKTTTQVKETPKETKKESKAESTENKTIYSYKDRADLYNQLCTMLPKENINKKTSENALLELAKKNGLEFKKQ